MDSFSRELDRLERKIDRLRREYDLFLAGRRRGEPSALRDEIEREVRRLTRNPLSSTATRFRAKSLAHRFQAVETQVRNLVELRSSRKKRESNGSGETASVVLDRAALRNPRFVERHVRALHQSLMSMLPEGVEGPALDTLRQRLLDQAERLTAQEGVFAVRFSAVVSGGSKIRIRGDVLEEKRNGEEG